jgi:hypothetical protein
VFAVFKSMVCAVVVSLPDHESGSNPFMAGDGGGAMGARSGLWCGSQIGAVVWEPDRGCDVGARSGL